MSVRVVARIRPLLKLELERDVIVEAASSGNEPLGSPSVIRIPNPKSDTESFSFQFNSVYAQEATQQDIFDNEVAPTVKHLFNGFDVTLFAYGVTGTGKTHTMRGGKTLAERGVIPRLLSSIYRRSRKIEKDTAGTTEVQVSMSYYEIYNDRVYDLFEPPEKRTPAGLPIRDNNGKSMVVGLTERPCTSLKDFELLYDQANVNRSTSATKLNAHSSRSHAILCVKLSQATDTHVRISTASAIDLAGSEDNRRTDNNKERLVESSNINKSLFVLAQCVEAISKKQPRIPYRESKMTRILSLGQNNGLTVMILNLAPVRSYHLDTLSSLNFANRTKKIEVREIENEPFFRIVAKPADEALCGVRPMTGSALDRQPLRPKTTNQNMALRDPSKDPQPTVEKPVKTFSVYSDKGRSAPRPSHMTVTSYSRASTESQKRASSDAIPTLARPAKTHRPNNASKSATSRATDLIMTQESIEALVERKVNEKLAQTALQAVPGPVSEISNEVKQRLDALERRVEGHEAEKAEGLQYLLMAKQHQVRGEDASALKMYQLALPFFPGNQKLGRKMLALQEKIRIVAGERRTSSVNEAMPVPAPMQQKEISEQDRHRRRNNGYDENDDDYQEAADINEDDSLLYHTKARKPARMLHAPALGDEITVPAKHSQMIGDIDSEDELAAALGARHPHDTPRTQQLLRIINSRDVSQIKLLKGVGAKKAEMIVNCLCDLGDNGAIETLGQLGNLKGVGAKTVESMRTGVAV
ncbi:hypothetical protein LTR66_001783 [Elasticomyces elasticus]|nr:hypothetical protein LTR50_001839 [Elasticomyces elasticus]KAK4999107.1 hypothetical protein LTR66_001783 [Elasticomyces elasticus]